MAAPHVHAESSARKYGGVMDDYLAIHKKMDCSKGYIPDNRHRALTHHMFWVMEVMIQIFGDFIVNSNNRKVPVKDICEQHILEDFRMKYIPSAQDYIEHMNPVSWINNAIAGCPSSARLLRDQTRS